MSAVEIAVEKVRRLDEPSALRLLAWMVRQTPPKPQITKPLGAMAMLGFARRFHDTPKTTAEWMAELRAGDQD